MANPYHDSAGQFCSKGEMQASIAKLNSEGKTNEALALMDDLKTIEGKNNHSVFMKTYASPVKNNTESIDYGNKLISLNVDGWNNENSFLAYGNKCEATLEGASDERVEDVARILNHAEEVHRVTTYAASLAEIEAIQKEVKSETGFANYDALYVNNVKEKFAAEAEGNEIVQAIHDEAVVKGLPRGYASYYFDKTRTELGLAPDRLNPYDNSIIKKPENITALSAATFPVKIRKKEHKAILAEAVSTVFTREATQAKLAQMNTRLEALPARQASAKEYNNRLYNTSDSKRREDVRARMEKLTNVTAATNNVVKWREQLRAAGVKTNLTRGTMLSEISGEPITTGKDGKVNNVWAVNTDSDTKERSLDRIVSVQAPDTYNNGGYLKGESGKTYSTGTHYRNYSSETTNAHLIVDETIQGDKPYAGIKHFKSVVDSGD